MNQGYDRAGGASAGRTMARRFRPAAAALAASALLLGCAAGAPDRFYTLAEPGGAAAAGPGEPARQPGDPAPGSIAVGPVAVPEIVDRPQLVVLRGGQQVAVLESRRWAQSLPADIAARIADELSRLLPGRRVYPDTDPADRPPGRAVLRIELRVERFETITVTPPRIADDIAWTLRCAAAAAPAGGPDGYLRLRETAEPGGSDDIGALVAAHGRALAAAGRAIAASIAARGSACLPDRPGDAAAVR